MIPSTIGGCGIQQSSSMDDGYSPPPVVTQTAINTATIYSTKKDITTLINNMMRLISNNTQINCFGGKVDNSDDQQISDTINIIQSVCNITNYRQQQQQQQQQQHHHGTVDSDNKLITTNDSSTSFVPLQAPTTTTKTKTTLNGKNICDCHIIDKNDENDKVKDCNNYVNNNNNNINNEQNSSTISSTVTVFVTICTCLLARLSSIVEAQQQRNRSKCKLRASSWSWSFIFYLLLIIANSVDGYSNEFDKTEQLLDNINLEQRIAAVFNKVAYGSTTKRSIPDNAYPVTTLATPLLTTYRYSDGNDEWLRVDVKNSDNRPSGRSNVDFESSAIDDREYDENPRQSGADNTYGADLEKDHVLPTSAPAADILKNNNNKHYNNPNRYNNDRLRPDFQEINQHEQATETVYKTTTSFNLLRNVRPTKSMYSKDMPSYVPPSRAFFTPPLPPEYQNPFADKPTLRGTNSDGFASRRPLPPPSLMPNKDRIPFRPDLPPNKVNMEKIAPEKMPSNNNNNPMDKMADNSNKKKTLNTPSQNVKLGEFYGLNRNLNETNFEYEKSYAPEPSITRILSGSNGRHDDVKIPDILYHTVTAIPNIIGKSPERETKHRPPSAEPSLKIIPEPVDTTSRNKYDPKNDEDEDSGGGGGGGGGIIKKEIVRHQQPADSRPPESVTSKKEAVPQLPEKKIIVEDVTTQMSSDMMKLPTIKEKDRNITQARSEEIWLICWNVHVYLVVIAYIILAIYSIYKLVRYENDPHMFSKSYFLTIHLMLTVICVLRIFYLIYDAYNIKKSFNIFLYEFLHSFPLSLLATTFAVLILFLLKRTLTHLEVKNPVILVVCAVLHILLCFTLSIFENFGHFEKASLIICRPVFVLLVWALGCSYLYLYRIIKNVLAKKSQNLSEMCTQNISYASHITIAVALLFVLLGIVQLYALFFIKVDRFNGEIKHHWILWGFELSVRFLEITIIILLAMVVSLKMSQREKQTAGGFPLFPCTTSDSSTDNIYPNNCNTNPNALNYSRNEMMLDNLPTEPIERPNLLKNAFQNDSFEKKSTLERYHSDSERPSANNFDRFERPNWSDRSDQLRSNRGGIGGSGSGDGSSGGRGGGTPTTTSSSSNHNDQTSLNNFIQQPAPQSAVVRGGGGGDHFDRGHNSLSSRNSSKKYSGDAKYYTKPKYDVEYNNDDYQHDFLSSNHSNSNHHDRNIYSEPIDQHHYERTRNDFERNDFDRRSRNSNTSGRRSTTGRGRKNHPRPHLGGIQTLPNHQHPDSMLVDEQGFVRFRHMQDELMEGKPQKKQKKQLISSGGGGGSDLNHFSDA